jgi:phospholipid-binding lipoprotein MlaA
MSKRFLSLIVGLQLCLTGCHYHCSNPEDPFESVNRDIYKFNMAFDATVLKPPAVAYQRYIPAPIRAGVNNVYTNIGMLPTIGNDILQLQGKQTIKDIARLVINTTLGLGGIGDVATKAGMPLHQNDFGLTLAHWGNIKSPYIMIPFLGPSTIRDGFGLVADYTFFTPYPYIPDNILYGVLVLRYVDLRSQMLDEEQLLNNALDPYALMRDAYLQHRARLMGINRGPEASESMEDSSQALYVPEDAPAEPKAKNLKEESSPFPITTAENTLNDNSMDA